MAADRPGPDTNVLEISAVAEHICDEIKLCDVQLKSEAETELRTAQEGCAGVLALLEARDSDV